MRIEETLLWPPSAFERGSACGAAAAIRAPVWECACGDGEIAIALEMRGIPFIATDLIDQGYGFTGVDFLHGLAPRDITSIVTDPPYKDAEAFVRRARSFTGAQVVMFMPLAFLQSGGRADSLWAQDPPDAIYVVPECVTMYPRGQECDGSGTQASAWYVWDGGPPAPSRDPAVRWLPTGANRRYAAVTAQVREVSSTSMAITALSDRPRRSWRPGWSRGR